MPNRDLQLRVRIVATVVALIALNVAFVTAMTWLFGTVGPLVIGSALAEQRLAIPLWSLPVPVGWIVVGAVAFLLGQLAWGYRRTLDRPALRRTSPTEAPSVHALVARLSKAADVPKPTVAVLPADVPNCFTVGRAGNATLAVTEPLLEELDDEELEAVLAHEIAHVKHRDVTIMTVGSLLSAVTQALVIAAIVSRGIVFDAMSSLSEGSSSDDDGKAKLILVLLAVAAFLTILVISSRVFRWSNKLLNRVLSRYREFAADREAARLTGDPTALARALDGLDDAGSSVPEADLRAGDSGVQALCILPYGTPLSNSGRKAGGLGPGPDDPTDSYLIPPVGDGLLPCSHPPTEARIEALAAADPD